MLLTHAHRGKQLTVLRHFTSFATRTPKMHHKTIQDHHLGYTENIREHYYACTWLHRHYFNYVVRRDYSAVRRGYESSGRLLRLVAQLLIARLHRLYCAYVVHPDAPSLHSTSRRSVALALALRSVTSSRSSTTPCVVARFVVRLHWLYFSNAVRHDYLSHDNTGSNSSTPRTTVTLSSARIPSTTHLD
jgi:hypothetical protein